MNLKKLQIKANFYFRLLISIHQTNTTDDSKCNRVLLVLWNSVNWPVSTVFTALICLLLFCFCLNKYI